MQMLYVFYENDVWISIVGWAHAKYVFFFFSFLLLETMVMNNKYHIEYWMHANKLYYKEENNKKHFHTQNWNHKFYFSFCSLCVTFYSTSRSKMYLLQVYTEWKRTVFNRSRASCSGFLLFFFFLLFAIFHCCYALQLRLFLILW